MSTPRVSVIVPSYNHGHFLSQRLDSVFTQTFRDYEVIILDDASSDQSPEIISRHVANPSVRFYPCATNSGSPFVQWNRGVKLAKGEFVWIAESDDFAAPELLGTLVAILIENPRVVLAYCQSWRADSAGKVLGSLEEDTAGIDSERWRHAFINSGASECEYLFWRNTVPNASAVVFRREVFLKAGGAPTDMRLAGDWLTWVRMLLIGDISFTPRCLNYFRTHPATARATASDRIFFDERWRVQRALLRAGVVSRPNRRAAAKVVANEYWSRIRCAARENVWREIRSGGRLFWPIFAREPAAALGSVVDRIRQRVVHHRS